MENKLNLSHDQASTLLNRWRGDPTTYFDEVLGVTAIWKLQQDLLNACPIAIQQHKPIYVGSGHSLGKDYICAGISLWFLQCYRPSIVIQTAPTARQVEKIMWGETRVHWANKKIDLGGIAFTTPYLEIDKDKKWYLIGFATKETGGSAQAGGGKFQGYHSQNNCIIVTEAQAVEDVVYDQIDALTTSANVLVIFIGNPTRAKGRFAKGLRDKVNNIVFNFSCLDNPNYKHKQVLIPGVATYEWVEDKRRRWGENDPRWYGRVLGQIPPMGTSSVFPEDIMNLMYGRHTLLALHSANAGVSVDVAGDGVDDEVIMSGKGGEVKDVYVRGSMSPSDTAHKAVKMCKEVNGSFIIIDCDGMGIKVHQELRKLHRDFLKSIQLVKFHGSAPCTIYDKKKQRPEYANMRAEAAFVARERGQHGIAAVDINAKELIDDLMEEEWFEKNGKIQLEDKDDIKERLGRSPGQGDCWKMLQWAFNQNYKSIDTRENTKLPAYAMAENTGQMMSPRNLPRYANTKMY